MDALDVISEEAAIRPCPLCGCEALGVDHPPHKHFFVNMPDHPGSYTIECPKCNLGLIADTEALAKAAWNSRIAPDCRSAIDKALRVVMEKEPSDEMERAYYQGHDEYFRQRIRDGSIAQFCYRAMVNQLLKELCGE